MIVYLNHVPTFTIIMQGRWYSDAFMRYIRKQFKEFLKGVSETMLLSDTHAFYTVPDYLEQQNDEDRRTPSNGASFSSSYNGSSAATVFTSHHIFK